MLLPIVAIVPGITLAPAAFAQTPPANKADCVKAKMKWDAKGGADRRIRRTREERYQEETSV